MSKTPDTTELQRRLIQSQADQLKALKAWMKQPATKPEIKLLGSATGSPGMVQILKVDSMSRAYPDRALIEGRWFRGAKGSYDTIYLDEPLGIPSAPGILNVDCSFKTYEEPVKATYLDNTAWYWWTQYDYEYRARNQDLQTISDLKAKLTAAENRAALAELKLKAQTPDFKVGARVTIRDVCPNSHTSYKGRTGTVVSRNEKADQYHPGFQVWQINIDYVGHVCIACKLAPVVDYSGPVKLAAVPNYDNFKGKINAIKELRAICSWGLREAKDFSEGQSQYFGGDHTKLEQLAERYGTYLTN